MGRVKDQVSAINVNAVSPDGTVTVGLSRSYGISVDLESKIHEIHTEDSLAEQVELALHGAMTGYVRAVEMIREEAYGAPRPPEGSSSDTKRIECEERCEEIEVEAKSPRKYAVLHWSGRDEYVLVLRQDAMRKLDETALKNELNAVIALAVSEHSRKVRTIQKDVYFGDSKFDIKGRTP